MASFRFTNTLLQLADENDGIVTRRRLQAEDFDHNEIQDGINRGLLAPVFPGTYAVARRTLTQRMLTTAATLHLEPAMVRGRSAAEVRQLLEPRPGVVDLATTRRRTIGALSTKLHMAETDRPGLVAYRPVRAVAPDVVDGLRLSTVPRMLFDIAANEPAWMLRRVWQQADYRKLLDLDELHSALQTSRRAGVPDVRALFLKHPGRFGVEAHYETPKEVDFLQLIIDAGLSIPEVNVRITIGGRTYFADFFWRLLRLVVELDDPSHDRPLAVLSDKVRDGDFFVAEIDVVRFETQTVAADPKAAMVRLEAILNRQRRRTVAA